MTLTKFEKFGDSLLVDLCRVTSIQLLEQSIAIDGPYKGRVGYPVVLHMSGDSQTILCQTEEMRAQAVERILALRRCT